MMRIYAKSVIGRMKKGVVEYLSERINRVATDIMVEG